ncbi:MAG: WD40/YVTN/BNR-like repeat-containing protein, partial [Acidobacteriota bacterium]
MKLTKLFTIPAVSLFLFLLLSGFGSLGSSAKPERPTSRPQPESYRHEQDESSTQAQSPDGDDEQDPDLPPGTKIDHETYLRLRDEYVALKRGIEPGRPFDPEARGRAIERMQIQEDELSGKNSFFDSIANLFGLDLNAGPTWTPLGPAPLPSGASTFSGRVTSVVVDPTNPNIVYLGAAQGGVWRSLDGGASWASIFDNAQSMAIGALAIAPSDHTILYVGTGEFNGCSSCFFGAGVYRIDNADTSAALVGPINPQITTGNLTSNAFSGRSISKILVHPTDPATIFVATASGASGMGGNALGGIPPMGTRGVYRSTNATAAAASVTFQKLLVTTDNSFDSPPTGNVIVADMVMEPGNPNNIVVAVIGQTGGLGGIYRSVNALSGTPNFSQALSLVNGTRVTLTINKTGADVTVYAATSETPTNTPGCTAADSGAIHKSTDGGATWSGQLTGGGGFCSGQCFYDMPIAVDPTNVNVVYIGGQTSSTCGGVVRKSIDGGASFANDSSGLHADSHAFFFDTTSTIYTGNDGGIWKRSANAAAGSTWA